MSRYSRAIQSLTAVSCDCLPDNKNTNQCFQEIGAAVTIAQVHFLSYSAFSNGINNY